jgi:FixJ family two-component response regulator
LANIRGTGRGSTYTGEFMMNEKPTVFIVDDDQVARESVVEMVTFKGLSAKGFATAEEFLDQYDPAASGCLVLDVRMPGMSGLQLQQQLRERGSTLPVIVITGHADVPMAVRAMQNGAITFLEKPSQDQELWRSVEQALNVEESQAAVRKQKAELETRLASLTEDESAVLGKLMEGLPNKRIAADLDIGLRTVELRRSNIMRKMNAGSLPELVRMAILVGFLSTDVPVQTDNPACC